MLAETPKFPAISPNATPQAQVLQPVLSHLSLQVRNPKWKKFLHTIALIFSNISFIYLIFINLNRLRDDPYYRVPFAQIARTQENNFAVRYGILEISLTLLCMYCQFYLTMEHLMLRYDHAILQTRRGYIKMVHIAFRFASLGLQYGFLYQLSLAVPLHQLLYGAFYKHYIYSTMIYTISTLLLFLFEIFAPLQLPPFSQTSLPSDENQKDLISINNKTNKKLSRLEKQRQKMSRLKPLDPKDPAAALNELNARFPLQETDDIVDVYVNTNTTQTFKIPPSRIQISSSDDDNDNNDDEDNEEANIDDWNTEIQHLDNLMDRMISTIEQRANPGNSQSNTISNQENQGDKDRETTSIPLSSLSLSNEDNQQNSTAHQKITTLNESGFDNDDDSDEDNSIEKILAMIPSTDSDSDIDLNGILSTDSDDNNDNNNYDHDGDDVDDGSIDVNELNLSKIMSSLHKLTKNTKNHTNADSESDHDINELHPIDISKNGDYEQSVMTKRK